MISVPVFDGGSEFVLIGCHDQVVLDLFSLGMSPAVVNCEFPEEGQSLSWVVELLHGLVVPQHDVGLLGEVGCGRSGQACEESAGLREYPWVADGAAGDEDSVNSRVGEAFDNVLGSEDVAATYNCCVREALFEFGENVPVGFVAVTLLHGAAVDDEGIDALCSGVLTDVPEAVTG